MIRYRTTVIFILAMNILIGVSIATTPAFSNWRQETGVFRIGIIVGENSGSKIKRLKPFQQAIEQALEMPVKLVGMKDQNALIDAFTSTRVEYGIFSALGFSAAWKVCKCLEPLVVPLAIDGARGFYSVILGHRDNPVTLSEMKDTSLFIPGKGSFSGYILPRLALASQGIVMDEDFVTIDRQTMPSAIASFLAQPNSAIAGWISDDGDRPSPIRGVMAHLIERGSSLEDFSIVWQSKLLPHGPHAVQKSLHGEAKVILQDVLIGMYQKNERAYDSVEPFLGGGFSSASLDDYKPLIDLLGRELDR